MNEELKKSNDLIVCCNFLIRVESLLDAGTRSQIPASNIDIITKCLTRVIEFVDKDIKLLESQVMIFGNTISAIDDIIAKGGFSETSEDLKTYLIDKLSPAIIEFKVNVGRWLTDIEFNYTPAQDKVLQDIIEVCLDNGYYFKY